MNRDELTIRLNRQPRRELAARFRRISGYVGGAVPPERWSKDDLVNALLEIEAPRK